MKKTLLLLLFAYTITACATNKVEKVTHVQTEEIHIIDKPIVFKEERISMTKEYIKSHYGKTVENIHITPKIIVLHWTADMGLESSFNRLKPQRLLSDRKDIVKASALNVSSQFLIARDGTIYRLMPEAWMARHVIGLNYSSIGVENIGGENNKKEDLTAAQLKSNIALVKHLKKKYPSIQYLIGHYEYKNMQSTSLWLEKDSHYRTIKADPGPLFMQSVRENVKKLGLRSAPKGRK